MDDAKDQSYFLFGLTQAQLACARFPLGARRKPEVRAYAEARSLPVARKPDSHEICFVPDGDYAALVARRAPDALRPGRIVDGAGRTLGRHAGVHRFTVGQRRGLGISGPVPLYVTELDAASGRVTVGPRAALERSTLRAGAVNWIAGRVPSGPRCAWPRKSGTGTPPRPRRSASWRTAPRTSSSTRPSRPSRPGRRWSSTTARRFSAEAGSKSDGRRRQPPGRGSQDAAGRLSR